MEMRNEESGRKGWWTVREGREGCEVRDVMQAGTADGD